MTDLQTAAQMALDALEYCGDQEEMFAREAAAVEALRAALKRTDPKNLVVLNDKIEPCPVAWMYDFYSPDDPTEIIRDWVAHSLDEVKHCGGVNVRPLYLHPKEN